MEANKNRPTYAMEQGNFRFHTERLDLQAEIRSEDEPWRKFLN
jgi:hypothetical protein